MDGVVPRWLDRDQVSRPLSIRINSGWHQIQNVVCDLHVESFRSYRLRPYSDLESLPFGDVGRQSAFTEEGIVKGSARMESILLFPMGIPYVGSMRQREHHAIKLVGESYFDDPELFEYNFLVSE